MTEPRRRSEPAALLFQRCPRCKEGAIFRALFHMNEHCATCGLRFDRGQPGYFTGAMYVSYALGIPIISLLTLIFYLVFPTWSLFALVVLAWGAFLFLMPWVWRYSRVLWIHFDRAIDPDDADEGPPVEMR